MSKQFFEVAKGLKIKDAVILSGSGVPDNTGEQLEAGVGSLYIDTSNAFIYQKQSWGWQKTVNWDEFYTEIENSYINDIYTEIEKRGLFVGLTPPWIINDGTGNWSTLYDLDLSQVSDFWSSKIVLFSNGRRLSDDVNFRYQYDISFCSNNGLMVDSVIVDRANTQFDYNVYAAVGFGPKIPIELKAEYVNVSGVWHLIISFKHDGFYSNVRACLTRIG